MGGPFENGLCDKCWEEKMEKPFPILNLTRMDFVENENDNALTKAQALAISDKQMEEYARAMADGVGGYNFDDSLFYLLDSIKKELKAKQNEKK